MSTSIISLESTSEVAAASNPTAVAASVQAGQAGQAASGMIALYATREAAQAVCPKDGQHVIVHAKKNASRGADAAEGWQVFAVVPAFASGLESLGEWSDVVNAVLVQQASDSLKAWRGANMSASSVPAALFTQSALREAFLTDGSGAVNFTREQLDAEFSKSATWQRIVGSQNYRGNPQYRSVAAMFKEKILSLAGRSHGSLTDDDLDRILAKLEEQDLDTQLGAYLVRRIQKIRKDRADESLLGEFSLDDL